MQIGELGAMDSVLLDVGRNQKRLTSLSGQLSSGLRINSAVDDPSGLGIAGRLQTISSGLGQGRQSIQEANNLLTVADGAMSTIADILQRMRSLVIEANSSLDSPQDQANLQAEIDQLTLEINRVAENTTFNGLNLFDGSLRSTPPNAYNQTLFIINPNTDGGTGLGAPQNPPSGPPLIDPTQPNTQSTPGAAPIEVSFTVNSFDSTTGTSTSRGRQRVPTPRSVLRSRRRTTSAKGRTIPPDFRRVRGKS
jgi:flagellin-like hook-associated protein FlgL